MATLRQKTAIKKTLENIGIRNPKSMGEIMVDSGYSPSMAKNPKELTQSKAWEKAMAGVNFAAHLQELNELASTANNEDKDNVLKGKDMLFKLGDKYPAQKSKVLGLFAGLESIEE